MLPTYATPIVGRDEPLAALGRHAAAGRRLLTLVGPAGVGKTRLAVAWAASADAGRVIFCDLRAARTRGDLLDVVLRALRLAVDVARVRGDVVRRAAEWIRARGPVVIVLDNFEQLIPEAVDAVALWRAEAPEATFVVTSRHPLRTAAETVVPVLPLALPDADDVTGDSEAARLFAQRAAAATGGAELGAAHAATVAEIVGALDGIPLAIELAAARLEVLSLTALHARMRERFTLLRQPDAARRDVADRHNTLWDAIDGSWQLLTPAEQRCLAQCAVFAGAFTLDAAEAVLDLGDAGPLDAVHALCQKSLVRVDRDVDGAPRLRLYESVREFALCKLREAAGEAAALARHAGYFLDRGARWADAVRGPDAADALVRLDDARDDLTAVFRRAASAGAGDVAAAHDAMRAALALSPLLATRVVPAAHLALLEGALDAADAAAPAGDSVRYAQLRVARGVALRLQGRLAEAEADITAALRIARAHGDAALEGEALTRLGAVAHLEGRRDEGRALHEEALALARRAGDIRGQGVVLSMMAITHTLVGDAAAAERCLTESLALLRAAGDRVSEGMTLARLAAFYLEQGRLDETERALDRCLALSVALRDRFMERLARGFLAALRHLQGDLVAARAAYDAILTMGRESGDTQHEATYGAYLAMLSLEEGAHHTARDEAERALALARPLGDPRVEGIVVAVAAASRAAQGLDDEAAAMLDASAATFDAQRLRELAHMVTVFRAYAAVVRAARAFTGDRRDALADAVRDARRVYDALAAVPADEVRIALRVLARGVSDAEERLHRWRVADDGAWFEAPGGARVSLANRPILAVLLATLVRQHQRAPDEALSLTALQAAGWPGERLPPRVGANRVHVALSTLRKMGLDPMLRRVDDGYRLDLRGTPRA